MQTINAKDLIFINDDEMSWLMTGDNKKVVFPTKQSFLDALVENGQAKERIEKSLKHYASELKVAVNTFGGMENVVRYLHDEDVELTVTPDEETPDIYGVLFSFVEYCIASGLHTEEITKYVLDDIFAANLSEENKVNSEDVDSIIIDKNASETYWFMSNEYGIGYEIVLYKLSLDEQEELKKQMENEDVRLCDSPLYIKACGMLLEEIIQLFGE